MITLQTNQISEAKTPEKLPPIRVTITSNSTSQTDNDKSDLLLKGIINLININHKVVLRSLK